MKIKAGWLILVIFCLSFTAVAAADITITDTAIKSTITPMQSATFKLEIANNLPAQDTFEINYFDIDWRLEAGPSAITIPGNSKGVVDIELIPLGQKEAKVYGVPIMISSTSNNELKEQHLLRVNVLSYSQLVELTFEDLAESFDPRMSNVIKVKVENTNDISIENLEIKVQSGLFEESQVPRLYISYVLNQFLTAPLSSRFSPEQIDW
jgi:uncharacterized membrane protein